MKTVACGRYIVKQKLGAGSFGQIHRGEDKETGQSVAIKLEPVKTRVPQLSYESKLYNIFKNGCNIPKFYWFGVEGSNNAMVIELLGKSLEDLAGQFPHHRLSLKTVLMLADQMLSSVQYIHSMNFIHRDIKPDNFMMGTGKNSNKVYSIDFGLSKKYRDPHSHQHIKYVENKDLTGTARYASLAALKGVEQSRRDDLEALGFVWLYLLRGDLPWMGLDAHNRRQKYDRICQVKEQTTFESLCAGFPEEFVRYFYAVRQLRFVEEPEYAHFRKMFRKLFIRLGYVYDYVYDWSKPSQNNKIRNVKTKGGDYLSDKGKKPLPPKIPNYNTGKQTSKSRKGINEQINFNNNLNILIGKFSTAAQPSKMTNDDEIVFRGPSKRSSNDGGRKERYSDLNGDDLLKNSLRKSNHGKSEADCFRMKIPKPKMEFSDSSDDQIQIPNFSKRMSDREPMSRTQNRSYSNFLKPPHTSSKHQQSPKTPQDDSSIQKQYNGNNLPKPKSAPKMMNKWKSEALPLKAMKIPKQISKFSDYSDEPITIENSQENKSPRSNPQNLNHCSKNNSNNTNNLRSKKSESSEDQGFISRPRKSPRKVSDDYIDDPDLQYLHKKYHKSDRQHRSEILDQPHTKVPRPKQSDSSQDHSTDDQQNISNQQNSLSNNQSNNLNNNKSGHSKRHKKRSDSSQDHSHHSNDDISNQGKIHNLGSSRKHKKKSDSSAEHSNDDQVNQQRTHTSKVRHPRYQSEVEAKQNPIRSKNYEIAEGGGREHHHRSKKAHDVIARYQKERQNNSEVVHTMKHSRSKPMDLNISFSDSSSGNQIQSNSKTTTNNMNNTDIINNANSNNANVSANNTNSNAFNSDYYSNYSENNENRYNKYNTYNSNKNKNDIKNIESGSSDEFSFERKDPPKIPQKPTATLAAITGQPQKKHRKFGGRLAETPERPTASKHSSRRNQTDVVRPNRIPVSSFLDSYSYSSSAEDFKILPTNNQTFISTNLNMNLVNNNANSNMNGKRQNNAENEQPEYKRLPRRVSSHDIYEQAQHQQQNSQQNMQQYVSSNKLSSENPLSPRSKHKIPSFKPTPRQRPKISLTPQQRHSLRPSANIPSWMNEKFKARK